MSKHQFIAAGEISHKVEHASLDKLCNHCLLCSEKGEMYLCVVAGSCEETTGGQIPAPAERMHAWSPYDIFLEWLLAAHAVHVTDGSGEMRGQQPAEGVPVARARQARTKHYRVMLPVALQQGVATVASPECPEVRP